VTDHKRFFPVSLRHLATPKNETGGTVQEIIDDPVTDTKVRLCYYYSRTLTELTDVHSGAQSCQIPQREM